MMQSRKLVDENVKSIFYTFKKEQENKSMPEIHTIFKTPSQTPRDEK